MIGHSWKLSYGIYKSPLGNDEELWTCISCSAKKWVFRRGSIPVIDKIVNPTILYEYIDGSWTAEHQRCLVGGAHD